MVTDGADLIVVEGMGRAIHTNFYAQFSCDSLKVAVLKNRWLARKLGGDMFSVVFKFEQGKRREETSEKWYYVISSQLNYEISDI